MPESRNHGSAVSWPSQVQASTVPGKYCARASAEKYSSSGSAQPAAAKPAIQITSWLNTSGVPVPRARVCTRP